MHLVSSVKVSGLIKLWMSLCKLSFAFAMCNNSIHGKLLSGVLCIAYFLFTQQTAVMCDDKFAMN